MKLTGANFCDMKLTGGNTWQPVWLGRHIQGVYESLHIGLASCQSHMSIIITSMEHVLAAQAPGLEPYCVPCSRLQAAAVAHGESLPIPEIVAIGGQSDGKSSLLEAFLGFRFNIR